MKKVQCRYRGVVELIKFMVASRTLEVGVGEEPLIKAMPGNSNFINGPAGTTDSSFLCPGSDKSVFSTEQIVVVNHD
jgi:hypothetical protein